MTTAAPSTTRASPDSGTRICPACRRQNPVSADRCAACGAWLFPLGRCSACSEITETDHGQCVFCGASFSAYPPARYVPRKPVRVNPIAFAAPPILMTLALAAAVVFAGMNMLAAIGFWFLGFVAWALAWVFVWNEKQRAEQGIFRPSDLPPFFW